MIDGIPILDFGAGALVTVFVLAILTGRLIPRRTYDDMREERDTWRASAERSAEHATKLLDNSELTVEIVKSVKRLAESGERP